MTRPLRSERSAGRRRRLQAGPFGGLWGNCPQMVSGRKGTGRRVVPAGALARPGRLRGAARTSGRRSRSLRGGAARGAGDQAGRGPPTPAAPRCLGLREGSPRRGRVEPCACARVRCARHRAGLRLPGMLCKGRGAPSSVPHALLECRNFRPCLHVGPGCRQPRPAPDVCSAVACHDSDKWPFRTVVLRGVSACGRRVRVWARGGSLV